MVLTLNIRAELLAFLLHIYRVLVWNLGQDTGYLGFSWFSFVPASRPQVVPSIWPQPSLPDRFQFVMH
jgi:hypothetical protein